jgi:hypothetical protein
LDPESAYPASAYMSDLRSALWGGGLAPDANRRALQRLYLQRFAAIVAPPAPATPGAGGPGGGGQQNPNARPTPAFLLPPDVQRSDLPALARSELRAIRGQARGAAAAAPSAVARAHWADVVDRIDTILDTSRR